jgi:DNA-binding CsgD family transcriptional regulator
MTNKEIEDRLFISSETEKALLYRAFEKTGTNSMASLTAWFTRKFKNP